MRKAPLLQASFRSRITMMPWLLATLCFGLAASDALADYSLNIGYQNPAPSTVGVNAQYLGQQIGVEVGLGWAKAASSDDDKRRASLALLGDVNVKYLFMDGVFRPYLEAGVTLENDFYLGSISGVNLSSGPPFFGAGAIFGSKTLYGYAGAVYLQGKTYAQGGVGWGF